MLSHVSASTSASRKSDSGCGFQALDGVHVEKPVDDRKVGPRRASAALASHDSRSFIRSYRYDVSPVGSLPVCLNDKSEEERVVYKELNSTGTLIQRTTMEAPQAICITSDWMFTRRPSVTA
jgi:hypothetical protein